MAKYLISFGEDFDDNKIVDGRAKLDDDLLTLYSDGAFSDGEEPVVYELGKKLIVRIETKVNLKGEDK
jgi:hypothetical protein